ncbi:MAG: NIPSNAP family protein [Burkholderiales bacterium]|nr:NIPSNAP family protein [Burkholderiales bacterium]
MIVDHRTYWVKPGKLAEYLKLYAAEGYPLQLKILGNNIGWYTSHDIGPLNQVVHMWAYDSLADREARRNKLAAEPAWQQFLEKAMPLLDRMENKILRPTAFFNPPKA